MARIRSVHPGLFTDDAVMQASLAARWLLIGIWSECDDQGAFQWRPATLKARIMPNDNVDVAGLLDELTSLNFVTSFEHEGVQFGLVRNFRKFQKPQKPKAIHFLPDQYRNYVGLDGPSIVPSSTPPPQNTIPKRPADHPNPIPVPDQYDTGTVKSPQREEGGGKREDGGGKLASSLAPKSDFEKVVEALGGFERVRHWQNLKSVVANWLSDHDLEADVLWAIRDVMAKKSGALPGSAAYFTPAIREAKERRIAGKINPQSRAPSPPLIVEIGEWRRRVPVWKREQIWDRRPPPDGWGPAPGEPGCLVPPELLNDQTQETA